MRHLEEDHVAYISRRRLLKMSLLLMKRWHQLWVQWSCPGRSKTSRPGLLVPVVVA